MTENTNPQIQEFYVKGMTCEHCVKRVSKAISDLPGVASVSIDLSSGKVQVESEQGVDREHLTTVIADAGYELV